MNHSFDLKVAMDFDVDTAIFLNHMAFWLQKNAANGRHIYDGNVWTYNTLDAFSEIFPYWSKRQIGRVIKNCIDYGLIKKGNFNKKGYDQTLWYSFTDLAYKYYKQINVLIEKPSEAAETLILPNSNIHITEPSHQYQLQYQLQNKDLKTLVDSSNTTRVKTYSETEGFLL